MRKYEIGTCLNCGGIRNKNGRSGLCRACYIKVWPKGEDNPLYNKEKHTCKNCGGECCINSRNSLCYDCYVKLHMYGSSNPNYKGLVTILCPCGKGFVVEQHRRNTAKYCSIDCKHKYSVSKVKCYEYKGLKLRSSWELQFAKYLDECGYTWKYEPESFKTPYGYYTPDFWIEDWQSFVEVKGYFRDLESKLKYEYFSKHYVCVLADLDFLKMLGFTYVKHGNHKGWVELV